MYHFQYMWVLNPSLDYDARRGFRPHTLVSPQRQHQACVWEKWPLQVAGMDESWDGCLAQQWSWPVAEALG